MSKLRHAFDVEDAFGYVILKTHRLLRWRFRRAMRRAGWSLTQEQFVMLNKLTQRDGCTQGELVNATFNDRANVSRMVTGLESQGYVTRTPDGSDGRVLRVSLTRSGKKLLEAIGKNVHQARQRVYRGLEEKDLIELKRICSILEENVLREVGER